MRCIHVPILREKLTETECIDFEKNFQDKSAQECPFESAFGVYDYHYDIYKYQQIEE
jgi:hypothetical protein